jgi:hypothetical protein
MAEVVLRGAPLGLHARFGIPEPEGPPVQPRLVEVTNVPDLVRTVQEYLTGEENYSDVMLLLRDPGGEVVRHGRCPTATPEVMEACARAGYLGRVWESGRTYRVEIVEGPEVGKGRHLMLVPMRAPKRVMGILVLPLRWSPEELADGHLSRIHNFADLAGCLLSDLRRRHDEEGSRLGDRLLPGLLRALGARVAGVREAAHRGGGGPDRDAVRSDAAIAARLVRDASRLLEIDQGRITWRSEALGLDRLLEEVLERVRPGAPEPPVRVRLGAEGLVVRGDRRALVGALADLVRFTRGIAGEEVRLLTSARHGGGIQICLHVPDRHVTARDLADALDPLSTHGSLETPWGLRLAVARAVLESHRGRLWFESASSQGTRLFLHLPPAREEGSGGSGAAGVAPASESGGRVPRAPVRS